MKKLNLLICVLLLAGLNACKEDTAVEAPQEEAAVTAQQQPEPAQQQPALKPAAAQPAPQQPAPKPQPAQPQKPAQTAKVDAVKQLVAWDKKLKTLKTDFHQTTAYEDVVVSSSKGRLYYEAPSLLRLEQLNADGSAGQVAITDKKDINIYDGAMQPVTDLKWQEWQQGQRVSALFDFGNYEAMINKHKVQSVTDLGGSTKIVLVPPHDNSYTLTIVASNTDYFPLSIALEAEGVQSKAQLLKTEKNLKLDKAVFRGFAQ